MDPDLDPQPTGGVYDGVEKIDNAIVGELGSSLSSLTKSSYKGLLRMPASLIVKM